jgi:N-methylhydantoinase A
MRLDRFDPDAANHLLAAMTTEAEELTRSAAGDRLLARARSAFMRYLGQGHEVAVALPDRDLTASDAGGLREAFEAEYRRLFERHIPNAIIEVLTWAVEVGTIEEAVPLLPPTEPSASPAPIGSRMVLMGREAEPVEIPVFARADLMPGAAIEGPALVVEPGTSTFVGQSFTASPDRGGALVLERRRT